MAYTSFPEVIKTYDLTQNVVQDIVLLDDFSHSLSETYWDGSNTVDVNQSFNFVAVTNEDAVEVVYFNISTDEVDHYALGTDSEDALSAVFAQNEVTRFGTYKRLRLVTYAAAGARVRVRMMQV